ncbi:MAG: serine hydrolase domain-containing protein [Gemmatimonadota bacterium]
MDAVFADIGADAPGAAVLVRQGGAVVHRAGYGTAHMDHAIPITPATVFDIASISKQFGAMTALLLAADGTLDLDADVRTWVPELPDFGRTITPRHLLHHTSGIRDWPHTMGLGGVEMSDVISYEKILRMLFHQQALNFDPGAEYAYSNTGYNLLALTLERASGMSFRALTEARIFAPLGMTHTHFSDNTNEIVPGRAESYAPVEGGWERRVNQLSALASSSLHTTIDDFTRWMENFETARVGGPEIVGRMRERAVLNGGDTIDYAYGLVVGAYRGLPTFRHGGSWAGYRTEFVRFPEQDLSIAVFCNFSTCDPGGRAQRIAEAWLEDQMEPAPEQPAPRERPEPLRLTAEQLAAYTGAYWSPEVDATYRVEARDGGLHLDDWRGSPVTLEGVEPDAFRSDHPWWPRVQFTRARGGEVDGLTVTGDRVRALRFERVER